MKIFETPRLCARLLFGTPKSPIVETNHTIGPLEGKDLKVYIKGFLGRVGDSNCRRNPLYG